MWTTETSLFKPNAALMQVHTHLTLSLPWA